LLWALFKEHIGSDLRTRATLKSVIAFSLEPQSRADEFRLFSLLHAARLPRGTREAIAAGRTGPVAASPESEALAA
jgi:hypothetical protein